MPVLDHEATVLHHLDAGARELLGELVVADAALEPDRVGLERDEIVEVVLEILGFPVVRDLRAVRGRVDIVDVFRKAEDLDDHLEDLLALKPDTVWLQSGIRDDEFAEKLARAGIQVVQDRCLMVEHRHSQF